MRTKVKLNKAVIVLGLVSLFTDIASEMLYPITPLYMTSILGASMALVGLLEGIAEFIAGLLKGYFGILSDKLQKRSIFVRAGYSLSALSKPLPGLFPFTSIIFTSRIADRIGKGIRTAPRDALLGIYSEGNSGAVFGFHRAMDTLGAAIGPVFALILLSFYPGNFRLVFLIAFIPSLFAVASTFLIKEKQIISKPKTKQNYLTYWKNASKKYKFLLIVFVVFSFANSSDVFLILKANNSANSFTFSVLAYITYNIIYALCSYPLGSLSDKYGKKKIFAAGLFIFSAVYAGFALLTSSRLIIIVLFVVYGVYAASTEGIMKAYVSDITPDEEKGSAIGLLTMLSSFAIMAGSFFTGVIWDAFGNAAAFGASAVIALAVSVVFVSKKI